MSASSTIIHTMHEGFYAQYDFAGFNSRCWSNPTLIFVKGGKIKAKKTLSIKKNYVF